MRVKIWGARGSIPTPIGPEEIREKIISAFLNISKIEQGDLKEDLITTLREEPKTIEPATDHDGDSARDFAYREAQAKRREMIETYLDSLSPLLAGTAGGNTPCIEIRAGDDLFIIDAGSGIRELGLELMKGECGRGEGVIHLLFSHPHWDHIQGFPFFRPAFVPGNKIFIYGVHDMEAALRRQQDVPSFPVSLDYMQADIKFRAFEADKVLEFGDLRIRNLKNYHPGDAYSFRFEKGDKVFIYASDAAYPAGVNLKPFINFFTDADVLIYDAQFTQKESDEKEDWGHSSSLVGVEMAQQAKVKTLVLYHYDPTYSDQQLDQILENTVKFQQNQYPDREPVKVIVAQEGQTFDLAPSHLLQLQQVPGGKASILKPRGIFDERVAAELNDQLAEMSRQDWPPQLIIDMSAVDMMQVTGLRALVKLRKAEPGLAMVLAGPTISVQQVIELTGYLDFFAIYPSVHAALKTFQTRKTLNLPGQMIKNRYFIESKIGDGRLGTVFKAVDTRLNQSVAIKILSPSFSEGAIEQFLQQARQIVDLIHPNIVDVYDCDEDRGISFMAEEFIESKTLRDLLDEHAGRPLPFELALHIAEKTAQALEYAHARSVIHGDLKPKNVLLADEIKVSDFGLGRLESGKSLLNLDVPLALVTAHYLAPEQILGHPIDDRTDLYALGVILYEIFTGQRPFEGSDQEVLEHHRTTLPPPPRELNPTLPHVLEHLILKLLDKDPNKRYASARQARRILGSMLTTTSDEVRERSFTRQHWPPLVEREKPLQRLVNLWEKTRQGQGQLVLISGEAGIGKTRLARELAQQLGDATLLIGNCHKAENSRPYQAFIRALRTYFANVALSGAADGTAEAIAASPVGQVLARMLPAAPELQHILIDIVPDNEAQTTLAAFQQAAGASDKRARGKSKSAGALSQPVGLAEVLGSAAAEQPWLLILDDLHRVDHSSLRLFEYLSRHCGQIGLMIVGLYRPSELENNEPLRSTIDSLKQDLDEISLTLEPLTEIGVKRLLEGIWSQTIPTDLIAAIYRRTGGNPLYIEEIVKGLMEEGVASRRNGRWRFAPVVEAGLPQRLRDAILRRTNRLTRKTQTLLNQATILGASFKFIDLHEMSDLTAWEVQENLGVALERQLINQVPSEDLLGFSHNEFQAVLYQSLSPLKRRVIHLEAAEALKRCYQPDLEQVAETLAYHFFHAGELEKSLGYSLEAAARATAIYGHQNALIWYAQALEALDQLDAQATTFQQRIDLLLAREGIHELQGNRQAQAADLAALQSLVETGDDLALVALVHSRQAALERIMGRFAEAGAAVETALNSAREKNDHRLKGECLIQLGQIAAAQGQFQAALDHLQGAQKILKDTGHSGGQALGLFELGMINRRLNNYDQAEQDCRQALDRYRSLGDRRGEANCLNLLGMLRLDSGEFAQTISHLGQALEINRFIGCQQGYASSLNRLAIAYKELGHLELAQAYVEKAQAIHHKINDELGEADDLRVLSAVQLAREDFTAARDFAGEALEIYQHLGARAQEGQTWLDLGLALEALADPDKANVAYSEAQTFQEKVGYKAGQLEAQAGLARCLLARGDTDAARKIVEAYLEQTKSGGTIGTRYPIRLYLTAYWVLQAANKKKQAIAALEAGQALLEKRAESIDSPDLRAMFNENVPENKEFWTQLKLHADKDTPD